MMMFSIKDWELYIQEIFKYSLQPVCLFCVLIAAGILHQAATSKSKKSAAPSTQMINPLSQITHYLSGVDFSVRLSPN